jgi:hypothetical protein
MHLAGFDSALHSVMKTVHQFLLALNWAMHLAGFDSALHSVMKTVHQFLLDFDSAQSSVMHLAHCWKSAKH